MTRLKPMMIRTRRELPGPQHGGRMASALASYAVIFAAAAVAWADDVVILADGDRVRGSIVSLSPDAV